MNPLPFTLRLNVQFEVSEHVTKETVEAALREQPISVQVGDSQVPLHVSAIAPVGASQLTAWSYVDHATRINVVTSLLDKATLIYGAIDLLAEALPPATARQLLEVVDGMRTELQTHATVLSVQPTRVADVLDAEDRATAATADRDRLYNQMKKPIPLRLHCPGCHELHVDAGERLTHPHRTHACQFCGLLWMPSVEATIGVRFLPGCKDEPESVSEEEKSTP